MFAHTSHARHSCNAWQRYCSQPHNAWNMNGSFASLKLYRRHTMMFVIRNSIWTPSALSSFDAITDTVGDNIHKISFPTTKIVSFFAKKKMNSTKSHLGNIRTLYMPVACTLPFALGSTVPALKGKSNFSVYTALILPPNETQQQHQFVIFNFSCSMHCAPLIVCLIPSFCHFIFNQLNKLDRNEFNKPIKMTNAIYTNIYGLVKMH